MTTRNPTLVVLSAILACGGVASAQPQPSLAPTFNKDVAPIFFANCTTCHRPGEVAPMSLLTYKDSRPWARSIATQVGKGAMPPWHADPAIGHFANARRLSDLEKATVVKWVESGAPEGDPADLPRMPAYPDGWRIGTPDVVLQMQEDYPIPETGDVPYVYFEVPANFDEDRWVQAWEMRPGNPAVVHHVIVYVRPPQEPGAEPAARPAPGTPRPRGVVSFAEGMDIPAGQTGGPPLPEDQRKPAFANARPRPRGTAGSIGGYVPGNSTRTFPAGTAMRLPKGSSLVFQMHYTTVGKPTTDRTRMGLIFGKEPPRMALSGTALVNGALRIPAGAANHRVDAEMTLNRDLLLFSMTPHTHVRGIRWYYEAVYPDGRVEPILSVPNYDFDWQHEYQFARPMELPAGTRIKASAWYDNSTANKSNPDPTKDVWWGDQTWEEMMFTSFTWYVRPGPTR
jgi:mono/diheme cytochrome c family protein